MLMLVKQRFEGSLKTFSDFSIMVSAIDSLSDRCLFRRSIKHLLFHSKAHGELLNLQGFDWHEMDLHQVLSQKQVKHG